MDWNLPLHRSKWRRAVTVSDESLSFELACDCVQDDAFVEDACDLCYGGCDACWLYLKDTNEVACVDESWHASWDGMATCLNEDTVPNRSTKWCGATPAPTSPPTYLYCEDGYVEDCEGDGSHCCPESWIGNGDCDDHFSLRGDGCDEVTEGNVKEFARLRATADLGGQQTSTIGALVKGFRDVVPAAALLLLESPEELREALAGVEALDVHEWRAATQLRGAFKDTPKHKVVEWFWSYVATLSHAKKAELLRWATGSARCPLGGFAKLHGRDGVLRPFTLTSVELAQCAYPRAHTCFNRIDLPLFNGQRDLADAFAVALDPRHAEAFSMD